MYLLIVIPFDENFGPAEHQIQFGHRKSLQFLQLQIITENGWTFAIDVREDIGRDGCHFRETLY